MSDTGIIPRIKRRKTKKFRRREYNLDDINRYKIELLNKRHKTFQELEQLGLPQRFPFGVDVALRYSGNALLDYLHSESFLWSCKERYKFGNDFYRTNLWTLKSIQCGAIPGGMPYLELVAHGHYMNFHSSVFRHQRRMAVALSEDIRAEFIMEMIKQIPKYVPGKIQNNGTIKFYDFGAFLSVYPCQKVRRNLFAEWRRPEYNWGLTSDVEFEREEPQAVIEISAPSTQYFLNALSLAMKKDTRNWYLFIMYVYHGRTLRELAMQSSETYSTIGKRFHQIQVRIADELFRYKPLTNTRLAAKPFDNFAKNWRETIPYNHVLSAFLNTYRQ